MQNIIARYRDFCWNDNARQIAIITGYNKTARRRHIDVLQYSQATIDAV